MRVWVCGKSLQRSWWLSRRRFLAFNSLADVFIVYCSCFLVFILSLLELLQKLCCVCFFFCFFFLPTTMVSNFSRSFLFLFSQPCLPVSVISRFSLLCDLFCTSGFSFLPTMTYYVVAHVHLSIPLISSLSPVYISVYIFVSLLVSFFFQTQRVFSPFFFSLHWFVPLF